MERSYFPIPFFLLLDNVYHLPLPPTFSGFLINTSRIIWLTVSLRTVLFFSFALEINFISEISSVGKCYLNQIMNYDFRAVLKHENEWKFVLRMQCIDIKEHLNLFVSCRFLRDSIFVGFGMCLCHETRLSERCQIVSDSTNVSSFLHSLLFFKIYDILN